MSRYKSSAPAGPSIFARPSSRRGAPGFLALRLFTYLADCLELYRQRRSLEALDDRMLKDIGLTRCDVEAEVSRPLWR